MLNEMMHRPVVMEKVVDFMRDNLPPFEGTLAEIQAYATERGMPIIPHETARFLDLLTSLMRPHQILEIGTAIGFSASLMARHLAPGGHLTTIDRYPLMYERALENFKRQGFQERITLLEGDAADILPTLEAATYDLVFMDSAKAKYVEFLPECLRVLKEGGVLLIDDVFQGGTIVDEEATIPKRVKKIHRKLNELMDVTLKELSYPVSLLPLGDGVLMLQKITQNKAE